MRRLRSHGITRDPAQMTQAPDGPWYYQQIELGFNYRLTDLQAALGLSQLSRVEAFVARRHEIARRYDAAFEDVAVTTPASCARRTAALTPRVSPRSSAVTMRSRVMRDRTPVPRPGRRP
jgi:dTDP-4-amino-4,6-dideoxygalactose transaminase